MNKARFIGIDLCRGLAAFAVILVHSGDETWGIPISDRSIEFRHLFYFAVPFFLAASFYFATKKLPVNISGVFWQKKFKRIVVPYLFWSIFFLFSKSKFFFATNNSSQIQELFSDPIGIIFLGAASYHLYFMPLLFIGMLWLYSANYFINKPIIYLFSLILLSLIIYQLLLSSNNSFDLGAYTAFADLRSLVQPDSLIYPLWRIALVNIAWLIRCLPYFLISVLLNQFKRYNSRWLYQNQTIFLLFLLFLLVDTIGKNYLPDAVSEIIIAYSLLLLGISSSKYLKDNNIITNLGICSFGIYLIHPFIKSLVEIPLVILLPKLTQSVSITSILLYSISTFLISWLVVSLMLKKQIVIPIYLKIKMLLKIHYGEEKCE